MIDIAISLVAAGLVVVSVALVVARIREGKRMEESTRALMDARREFGDSIERLYNVVVAQDSADASRRSSGGVTWAHDGARPAYPTIKRAPFYGRRRNRAASVVYWSPFHARNRHVANDAWEDEWTVENGGADEYAPSDSWR